MSKHRGTKQSVTILLYSRSFLPATGGIQTIVFELARGLAEWLGGPARDERFKVTVVTDTPGAPEQDDLLPYCVVRKPSFHRLIRLLRGADIVHLAGPALMPLSLALLWRKPVIVEHHGFQVICPNGQMLHEPDQIFCPGHFMAGRYWECVRCVRKTSGLSQSARSLLLTPIRRWLSNRANKNIMPTDWLATLLTLRRSTTVHHGISPGFATGSRPSTTTIFAYQGRLVSTKGVSLLLRAFERLCNERRDLRLKIIGDGPDERLLKAEAAKLNGHVEFLGRVPDEVLDQALSDVATVVMPSVAGEVFGLVAVETMFRGKLLIVSDLGALREVVGETALVFPAGDANALADAMRRALDNSSQVATFGRMAHARAIQVFGREGMIKAHVSLYREALRRVGR